MYQGLNVQKTHFAAKVFRYKCVCWNSHVVGFIDICFLLITLVWSFSGVFVVRNTLVVFSVLLSVWETEVLYISTVVIGDVVPVDISWAVDKECTGVTKMQQQQQHA